MCVNMQIYQSKWEENKSQLEIQLSRIEDQLRENESRSRDVQLASRTPCSSWSNQDNVAFANDCRKCTHQPTTTTLNSISLSSLAYFYLLFNIESFFFSFFSPSKFQRE